MEKIKFVLNEKLSKIDGMGEGYIYEANQHPTIENIMIVHYDEDQQAYYDKDEFNTRFDEGHWIKI